MELLTGAGKWVASAAVANPLLAVLVVGSIIGYFLYRWFREVVYGL